MDSAKIEDLWQAHSLVLTDEVNLLANPRYNTEMVEPLRAHFIPVHWPVILVETAPALDYPIILPFFQRRVEIRWKTLLFTVPTFGMVTR
jgi:hypothetical protein